MKGDTVKKVDDNVEGSVDENYSMFTKEAEWKHLESKKHIKFDLDKTYKVYLVISLIFAYLSSKYFICI